LLPPAGLGWSLLPVMLLLLLLPSCVVDDGLAVALLLLLLLLPGLLICAVASTCRDLRGVACRHSR
jgi:hypothetical protein